MSKEHVLDNFYKAQARSDRKALTKKASISEGYMYREEALENFYMVKEGSRKNPNERTFKHRGRSYAYDHREYTHGTGKRLGIGSGMIGAGVGLGGRRGSVGKALGVGAITGGGGYILGRSLFNNLGEEGVKGLISQKSEGELKRIKLRRIN